MQAAQDAPGRARVVVLHEAAPQAGRGLENALVETLEKEAALVGQDTGFQDQHVGDGLRDHFHQNTLSTRMRIRYLP
ncbi:hypothetical protein D9M68_859270 [compost metagenome]